jgi:hypothetical protein
MPYTSCEHVSVVADSHWFQNFSLSDPFWLRKMTTDSHILAYVNTECPDDRYPELNMCIPELTVDSYQYVLQHT